MWSGWKQKKTCCWLWTGQRQKNDFAFREKMQVSITFFLFLWDKGVNILSAYRKLDNKEEFQNAILVIFDFDFAIWLLGISFFE